MGIGAEMTIFMNFNTVKEKLKSGLTLLNKRISMQAGTYIKEFVHGDLGRTYPRYGPVS